LPQHLTADGAVWMPSTNAVSHGDYPLAFGCCIESKSTWEERVSDRRRPDRRANHRRSYRGGHRHNARLIVWRRTFSWWHLGQEARDWGASLLQGERVA